MIKLKVNKRDIRNNFKNVLYCGYCELCDLLSYVDASYYNANSYGWRNDIYLINTNTVIVTGYEPFGNIEIPIDIAKKYNDIAKKIKIDEKLDFEAQKEKIDNLIDEMIKEIKNNCEE